MQKAPHIKSKNLVPHFRRDGDLQIVYLGDEPIGSIRRHARTPNGTNGMPAIPPWLRHALSKLGDKPLVGCSANFS